MKHATSVLTLTALSALGAYADTWSDTAATTPEWSKVAGTAAETVVYSTTQTGAFKLNLGDAAIGNKESFTLTIEATMDSNPWTNGSFIPAGAIGSGVESSDIYSANGEGTLKMTYTDNSTGDDTLTLYINKWNYPSTNAGSGSEAPYFGTNGVNTDNVPETISATDKLTIGFTITYDSSTNRFRYDSSPNSDITFTGGNWHTANNSLAFDNLTNWSDTYTNLPTGLTTTISITKAGTIPEPSAFGLLAGLGALALVASRRRRK